MHMHRVRLHNGVTLITQISYFRIHPSVSAQSKRDNNGGREKEKWLQ